MTNFLLTLFSNLFLVMIEIGVLAFIITVLIITTAVIVKIIKNKKQQQNNSSP